MISISEAFVGWAGISYLQSFFPLLSSRISVKKCLHRRDALCPKCVLLMLATGQAYWGYTPYMIL